MNGDIGLIDAVFTATSAVCVTGLIVIAQFPFFQVQKAANRLSASIV